MRHLSLFLCVLLLSCGPSKKELQETIDCKSDTIRMLRQAIVDQSDYVDELQEKLDNVRSLAEDVQSALDDGSFSDAYDAASDVVDGANYDY